MILNEIIIEGRADKSAQKEESQSVQDIKYLSRKEIRHVGSKGVGEILKRLPGIVVQGPPMAYRNVKVNGLDKEYQTIFIDGSRPAGGEDKREFKLDRIPASLIEGVEVIYNPTVRYGGSSPAGMINLKTKTVPENREFGIDLGLDQSNTHPGIYPEGSIYFGDSKEHFGFLLYASRYQYSRTDKSLLIDRENDISGIKDELSQVRLNTFASQFEKKLGDRNVLKLRMLFSDQKQQEDIESDVNRRSQGGLSYKRDTSLEITQRKLFVMQISHEAMFSNWKVESSAHWDWSLIDKSKDRVKENSPNWETSLEEEQQVLRLIGTRSDWTRNDFYVANTVHSFKTGLEFSTNARDFDRFAYTKDSSHKYWDEVEDGSYFVKEAIGAAYLSHEIAFSKWIISPGVRLEQHIRQFETSDTSGMESYRAFLPAFHAKYELGQSMVLRSSISRQNALQPFLYMVPVLKVKHKKEIIEKGNPDLAPAKSWNYHLSIQQNIRNRSNIKAKVFYTNIRDVVEMRYLGIDTKFHYRTFQAMNVDTAMLYGSSIEFLADLLDFSSLNLRFWGSVSLNGSSLRDPGTHQKRRLNDQATSLLSLNTDFLLPKTNFRFGLGYTWVGKRETFATTDPSGSHIPGFYNEAFGQLDCSIKYYFTRWGYFSLSIHNLLDEVEVLHQEAVTEELLPGRLVRFGLSLTF